MKLALLPAALTWLVCACTAEKQHQTSMESPPAGKTGAASPENLPKTEEEWRQVLTPEQFYILREAGTERPFGETYEEFNRQGAGTYHCGGCDAELFSSNEKFDSHCGWPSFYDPSNAKNVVSRPDYSGGMLRTEVNCAVCGGHLGHVFQGEGFDTPTDLRYCINGVALKFVPAAGESSSVEGVASKSDPSATQK